MGGETQGQRGARVLVVEDDDVTRGEIEGALRRAGFEVRSDPDGTSTLELLASFRPDVVLLDVGLPGGTDGHTLARKVRAVDNVILVFLTGAGAVEERLRGFEVGADDYLVKPVSVPELVARVRALARRANPQGRAVWRVGDLMVDEEAHSVMMGDEAVSLTALEFSVLACLCRTPGRVISKVQLLNEVWGFDHYALNVVEVHVSSLRKKLEAHGPRMVHTVRNVGYVVRA
jgi:DNA-binding response OmpR family regulator